MLARLRLAENQKDIVEKGRDTLKREWQAEMNRAFGYLKKYRECYQRLQKIALRAENRSEIEYLKEMIEDLESRRPPNYIEKKKVYQKALEFAERSQALSSADSDRELQRLLDKWFGELV